MSDSLRFVFAWSILHSCLLYTPAPFEDRIYRLLFLDHDQFSYSQLGLRLRQVCRYRLAGEDLYQHISLDGFSEPHRHIAGLGFLDLGRDHSEKIENLRRELTELRLLKQQLRKLEGAIDETSKRQGLQHLVGTIIVYEGDAHLQMAEQRIQLLDQAARRARSPVLPRYEASEIEEDLMHAKRAYEEVFYGYQEAQYGEITRQGGEGMIKIQEILRDWSAHSESINTAERLDNVSLLQLYQRLQEPLRSRMVQAYGTPSYRFACGGGTASASISIATGVGDLPSRLYDAGQRVLSSVGKPEEAFLWLSAGSDDMMLGAEMLMLREAGTDMSPMAIDIPMTTSTNLIPSLRNCMKRVGQTVAAVWRDSDESPDESSTLSPSAVLSALKPEIRCAVLVQYSLNHDQTVRIHIARTEGSIVERDCHVSYEQVCATKAGFYKKVWDDEHYLLRDLDPLVSPIYDVTMPGDLAILIPGPVCGGVLLHVLRPGSQLALYDSNAVTYVPGLRTLGQCVARARSASADASRRMRTTAVGVWERPPANMETQQKIIHTTVDGLAKAMRGNALKGSAATRKAFQDAVRNSEFLYFIGHGAGGGAEGISPPHLILHGQDKFFASDLLKTGLPGSLTILFGCSTARFRERQAKEHLNMSSACLAAGGVAVLGSMITIYTPASVGLAAKATIELAAARMNHTPGRLYNLAEAFRRGLKKARESVDVQKLNTEVKITEDQLWGAFIHVGSPLIALDDLVPVAQPNTI